ncbi:hypothetical protein [Pseudomonas cannabina]
MQIAPLCIEGLRKLKVGVCVIGMVLDNPGERILDEPGWRLDRHFKCPEI